jgi:hypothetical protein
MPAKVSAKKCDTHVLNPAVPCVPAKCQKDCAASIKGGLGVCLTGEGHPYNKGCYCMYCPWAAASSTLPRKLNPMN